MALDILGLTYFMPLFAFFFVFLIVYTILQKSQVLGESKFVQLVITFIISIIFSTVSSFTTYVETIVPWFAILIIILLFVMMIIGFSQKEIKDFMKPGFVWFFVILLIVIFFVAAINVFSPMIAPYFIGGSQVSGNRFLNFIYSGRFLGSILLLILTVLVSWVITREK